MQNFAIAESHNTVQHSFTGPANMVSCIPDILEVGQVIPIYQKCQILLVVCCQSWGNSILFKKSFFQSNTLK